MKQDKFLKALLISAHWYPIVKQTFDAIKVNGDETKPSVGI